MTRLYLMQGDITTLDIDAIVNSANNDLILGEGVSGAIRRIGGAKIQEDCNKIGTIPLGRAAVTTGGDLPCRWVIHAAVLPLGLWADEKSVRNGIRSTLQCSKEKGIKSLAFPAVGAGAGAFPIDRRADIILGETAEHLRGGTSIKAVVFVLYDEKRYKVFEEHFGRVFPETPIEPPPAKLPRAFP